MSCRIGVDVARNIKKQGVEVDPDPVIKAMEGRILKLLCRTTKDLQGHGGNPRVQRSVEAHAQGL